MLTYMILRNTNKPIRGKWLVQAFMMDAGSAVITLFLVWQMLVLQGMLTINGLLSIQDYFVLAMNEAKL